MPETFGPGYSETRHKPNPFESRRGRDSFRGFNIAYYWDICTARKFKLHRNSYRFCKSYLSRNANGTAKNYIRVGLITRMREPLEHQP